MVNKFLLTICGLIALAMVVWNGAAVFSEQEISEGQRGGLGSKLHYTLCSYAEM